MRTLLIILVFPLLFACSKAPEPALDGTALRDVQKEEQYNKEIDEIKKSIKGDIRIKLKKDGKGDYYSWEISGRDAHEVLKANDTINKKLGAVPAH